MKKHSDQYLMDEIEWCGRHEIDLIYGADANTGALRRDVQLAEFMVKTKERYGFPRKFRAAYAKNSVERVFEMNKILAAGGMSKGATLSFQSMDENTLDIIKRKNIGTERYTQLMKKYNQEGIPTYSEIIIGLPGETYDTFVSGLDTLLNAGAHASLSVYTCECLPNSEMSQPAYRQEHGIVGVNSPIPFYHASPDNEDGQTEHYELVVETKMLSRADWLSCQLFSWAIQAFHCLGATQACAIHLRYRDGVSYRQYYEGLLRFARRHPDTLLGTLHADAVEYFTDMQEGRALRLLASSQFGNVSWPPEEWAYLLTAEGRWQFYGELPEYLTTPASLNYQMAVTSAPLEGTLIRKLPIGFVESLEKMKLGDEYQDSSTNEWVEHEFVPVVHYPSIEVMAKEAIWFGRKSNTKRVEVKRK